MTSAAGSGVGEGVADADGVSDGWGDADGVVGPHPVRSSTVTAAIETSARIVSPRFR
jgi:hypothetical protein